ncbi:hypothetical protein KIN20_025093 [Parelaphostrongylus tenuis]|uniref:Uncharacterized protein n=1 Tax=Parelaphostrongylus tenuis TaxID=148309 RepID=A0AAD5QX46_PARTN|nr:hypothetical protein KIN20_025093 [Parelaphostrongylus tenuis]
MQQRSKDVEIAREKIETIYGRINRSSPRNSDSESNKLTTLNIKSPAEDYPGPSWRGRRGVAKAGHSHPKGAESSASAALKVASVRTPPRMKPVIVPRDTPPFTRTPDPMGRARITAEIQQSGGREYHWESSFSCASDDLSFVYTAFRMEISKEEIRLLLHSHYKLGVNASVAHRQIYKRMVAKFAMFVELGVGSRQFEEGDRLTDKLREGRPRGVHHQAIVSRIEEGPSMSCRMLADEFDCDPMTI